MPGGQPGKKRQARKGRRPPIKGIRRWCLLGGMGAPSVKEERGPNAGEGRGGRAVSWPGGEIGGLGWGAVSKDGRARWRGQLGE